MQRLAPVEGDGVLRVELALGRAHDEVLGQDRERRVVVALAAAHVEERGAAPLVVAESEVGALHGDAAPARRDGADPHGHAVLAENARVEALGVAAACRRGQREQGERGRCEQREPAEDAAQAAWRVSAVEGVGAVSCREHLDEGQGQDPL